MKKRFKDYLKSEFHALEVMDIKNQIMKRMYLFILAIIVIFSASISSSFLFGDSTVIVFTSIKIIDVFVMILIMDVLIYVLFEIIAFIIALFSLRMYKTISGLALIITIIVLVSPKSINRIFAFLSSLKPSSYEGTETEFVNLIISSLTMIIILGTSLLATFYSRKQFNLDKRMKVMPLIKAIYKTNNFTSMMFSNDFSKTQLNNETPIINCWIKYLDKSELGTHHTLLFQNISNIAVKNLEINSVKVRYSYDDENFYDESLSVNYDTVEKSPLAINDHIRLDLQSFPIDLNKIPGFPTDSFNCTQLFFVELSIEDILSNKYKSSYTYKLELNGNITDDSKHGKTKYNFTYKDSCKLINVSKMEISK